MIWLLIFGAAVGFLAACVVAEQLWFERRPPRPAVWHVMLTPPPLPRHSAWMHADLRHTRPPGRHRTPGGPV